MHHKLHLSLGTRLGLLVALLLGAFTTAYWVAHHELGAIERLYQSVVGVHDPALDAAYKMHLSHVAIGVAVNDSLAGMTDKGRERLEIARAEFARNMAVLTDLTTDRRGQATLDDLRRLHTAYAAGAGRMIELGERHDAALAEVATRMKDFRRSLIDALLPVAFDPVAAHALRLAVDRLDEAARQFLLAPSGRAGWRFDEALKYFQGDLSQHLARAGATGVVRHAGVVRARADDIDRAVQDAVASARALAAATPLFREQSQLVDYRLATRFEPQARAAMRSATAAALTRIQNADRRAALLLVAALLVGTLASVLIVCGILGPIRRLLAGTHAVASGNYRGLDDVSGRDELAALGAAFNAMARSLEQTTISRKLFDDILRAMDEALFVVTAGGDIQHVNLAACRLAGTSPERLLGCNIAFLLRPAQATAVLGAQRNECWLRTADGELAVLAARTPLDVRPGEAPLFVVTALDITARRLAERALAASRDELQALHASLDTRLETERATLSHELHDELGALLTAMKTTIYLAAEDRLDGAQALRELGAMTDSMSEATARIVNGLRPPVLDHFGLVAALDWYTREFAQRAGLSCRSTLPGLEPALAPPVALALFRAAQECLTNAGRHAGASRVRVELSVSDGSARLGISDDGVGCSAETVAGSQRFGLRGLRERLRALGGTLDIDTAPGAGLRASITVPCATGCAASPARIAATTTA